jgi:osmotically-inducible protein OsmY
MRTDAELQHDVMCELEWDSRVDHTDIGVTARHGIVTLTGTVDSWAKRVAAQQAAHRVREVLDVANDVQVKFEGLGPRSDADIARAVRAALEWNVFVPARLIRSTVSDGRVTLEGEVESLTQHDDAERAIQHLVGVRLVINDIVVKPAKGVQVGDVRQAVHDALGRRAERESHRLNIESHEGFVTLSGSVHSWAEKKAAIGAARGTPGVRSVTDELRIEP